MSIDQKYAKYKAKYIQAKTGETQMGGYIGETQMGGQNGNLQDIMTEFFSHLIMIKMLHFQSNRYGSHKTLDKYYNKFNKNMDKIMEILQGDQGRISIEDNNLTVTLNLANESTIISRLDDFKQRVLIDMINSKYGSNVGMIAIRDEILADLDQLKYLLTFK